MDDYTFGKDVFSDRTTERSDQPLLSDIFNRTLNNLGAAGYMAAAPHLVAETAKANAAEILGARDFAYLFSHGMGTQDPISRSSGYLRESAIVMPRRNELILLKTSPLITNPEILGMEPAQQERFLIDRYRKQSPFMHLPLQEKIKAMDTVGFAKSNLATFLFEDQASDIGKILKRENVARIGFTLPSGSGRKDDYTYAAQLWVRCGVPHMRLIPFQDLNDITPYKVLQRRQ